MLAVAVVALFAIWPSAAHADAIETGVVTVLNWIFQIVTYILGTLLVTFIDILVWIAQYNDFINAPAVQTGWAVTRDLANMFFIVALLLISIGTVFRIQEYRYTSMLRKLIMMAILINFSKTIAAFFIDLSQVVMLTFVNAFKDMAAGNLTQGFGIDKIVSFSKDASASGGDISPLSVAGAMFAAVVMLFIALIVVAIFVILLAQRIVMLWIYIVLAPTAYMVAVLPGSLGSWWGSWWRDFSQYLIKGPVIAFFLWLALTIISLSNQSLLNVNGQLQESGTLGGSNITNRQSQAAFASEATTSAAIINYIIAIGMLIAGLQQATKASGLAGNVAGKWMGNLNRWGGNLAMSPINAAKGVGGFAGRKAYDVARPTVDRVREGALGLASKINVLGIGAAARKQQAVSRETRLRAEDKDTSFVRTLTQDQKAKYVDEKPVTFTGKKDQKAVFESIVKNGELRNYSPAQRENILGTLRSSMGYKLNQYAPGKIREESYDADLLKTINDAGAKDPSVYTADWGSLSGREKVFRRQQMRKTMGKMTADDIAKMSPDAWKDPVFTEAVLGDTSGSFLKRFDKEPFRNRVTQVVPRNVQESMRKAFNDFNAGGRLPASVPWNPDWVSFQEDVDTDRQERTAAKIREFEKRGQKVDDFYTSADYTQAAPGTYFGQRDYLANLEQEERRRKNLERQSAGMPEQVQTEKDKEAQVAGKKSAELTNESYVRGLESFGSGSSNMMAVTGKMLELAGIKDAAGGHVRGAPAVEKLAGVMRGQLNAELDSVNKELLGSTNLSERAVLEKRKTALQSAIGRLDKPEELGKLQFVNADRHGGNVWNLAAEEKVHEKLDTIDPDGSFRKQLMQQFSAEELENITASIRSKTGDTNISQERAFEEYLSKGLVNTMGEKYSDSSTDAIKLRSDLPLLIKRQGERQLAAREAAGQKLTGAERRKHMVNVQSLEDDGGGTATHEVPAKSRPVPVSSTKSSGMIAREESVVEETRSEAVTNITNITNIHQEVKQAFQRVPETYDKLKSITPDVLNNALKNTIVWQGLMKYVKNIAAEVEESSKQAGVNTEGLQKEFSNRLGKMDSHLQAGNAEEFKQEFASLQNLAGGSDSSTGDSYSEAA